MEKRMHRVADEMDLEVAKRTQQVSPALLSRVALAR